MSQSTFVVALLLAAGAHALRVPPPATRRELLKGVTAAGVLQELVAHPALVRASEASDGKVAYGSDVAGGLEFIVPQSELLAKLASAPVRNIIITGANSGVGFAGAKILTAAGHHVQTKT